MKSTRNRPAPKQRAFEKVSAAIRGHLADGTLRVGSKLPAERVLAADLGVSRPAVREAFRSLEVSGVLEFETGMTGGAFIRQHSSDGMTRTIKDMVLLGAIPVRHLTEVRASMLGYAARLATERATAADFAALGKNIDLTEQLAPREDLEAILAISNFYRLIGIASHNAVLSMLIDSTCDIIHDLLLALRLRLTMDIVPPRRRILDRLVARDGPGAAEAINDHLAALTTRWPLIDTAQALAGARRGENLIPLNLRDVA